MDKKQMKGAVVLLLVTAVFLGALSFAADGGPQTLTGTGKGYAGDVVVEMVVDGDVIKSITVVEANDTPGLSDDAFEQIIAAVLANQSVDGVDVVSGATGSSNGILEAIKAALASSVPSGPVTYTGTGKGYAGDVVVQVNMDGSTITAIEVLESSDTPGLSDDAFEQIIAAVMEQQSLDGIDVVSGATGSSNGILEALANAIPGAGGETGGETDEAVEGDVYTGSGQGYDSTITVEVTVADGEIAAINVVEAADTPGLSDNAFEEIIASVLANQSVEGVDVVAGATGSSNGILEAISSALSEVEGEEVIEGDVYTGSGQGYDSTITVEVTMADGEIAAINVVEAADTPGLSDNAFEEIIAAVLANQSVEGVDAVAGATGSSNGILTAIEEALAQQ